MQKRRELKAAGIVLRRYGKKKREVEYNKEIPFEKKPALGFYDTENEQYSKDDPNFIRLRKENQERKEKNRPAPAHHKKKQQKENEDLNINDLLNESNKEPSRKRSKLVLPAPQISDQELEEVVKLGLASEQACQQAEESGSTQTVTGQLLGNYQMTPDLARLRTPMIPSNEDTILTESQNILALQIVDTPLKGGVNTPLHSNEFSTGATPAHKTVQTPNTMFQTPFRTPHGEITATPTRTPLVNGGKQLAIGMGNEGPVAVSNLPASGLTIRDKLNINSEDAFSSMEDKAKQVRFACILQIFILMILNRITVSFRS